ncbi:MAG: recombinase A [Myxococcales bacterium]|nr:recombinase A [Myxococcales bacterium]
MGEAVINLFERFATAEDLSPTVAPSLQPRWSHAELAGRLVELSGQGALTAAMGLVLDAQKQGEPVAWISAGGPLFYPPDVQEGGIDVAALIVVRVQGGSATARAADKLLRSGAFGLVVLDLGVHKQMPMPLQARLIKLAQKHAAVVLAVTQKSERATSLSSLVSLRCAARRQWIKEDRYLCSIHVLKDKRRGPAWSDEEELRAPAGASSTCSV